MGLETDGLASASATSRPDIHDEAIKAMLSLFHRCEAGVVESRPTFDLRRIFEDQVSYDLDTLWALLGPDESRRAEDYWRRCISNTASLEILDSIPRTLLPIYPFHETANAITTMKKIRMAMTQPQMADLGLQTAMFDRSDVRDTKQSFGHTTGTYKDGTPVLVEWMWYNGSWNRIDADQRSMVMNLRAQSFGIENKPEVLRTLNCLGVFEETGGRLGYGFVYSLPVGTQCGPVSLAGVLEGAKDSSRAQPILGDKFRLASKLAGFMRDFHTAG